MSRFATLALGCWVPFAASISACAVPAMPIYPCEPEGTTRSCSNTCGEGMQICQGGSWAACEVPPLRQPCHNRCGEGTRLCQDNRLADECDMPPVRSPCSNACGEGTRLCQDDTWSDVCEVAPVVEDCSTLCGPGTRTCTDATWGDCTAPQPTQPKLTAIVRDFHTSFPDVDHDGIAETGIVADTLGDDDKPVYAHTGPTATVAGPDTFNEWYRDVPGVNLSTTIDLPLTPSRGQVYGYINTGFFPIDNQLFGDEGEAHNYGFTVEIATSFRYRGGETFTFSGDDDVFVFINRRLAIDLGGIHSVMSETVDLDGEADVLNIRPGAIYAMHIFFAERHPIASDFVVETTISELATCN